MNSSPSPSDSQQSSPKPAPEHSNTAAQSIASQQNTPSVSRDTTPVPPSKPATPGSDAPVAANATNSAPHTSVNAPVTSSVPALSATAPQFRTRLIDAPIDLAALTLPSDVGKTHLRTSSMDSGSFDAASEFSSNAAVFGDGRTPTQESFPPLQTSSLIAPSPSLVSNSSIQSPTLTATSISSHSSSELRTPNVYINGLPPNFPEDKLLEMTAPFGEVLSVRTFTRHVSEKPSGYGFVLFSSVDAAEKCIESLRKFRNLHPSFSKQIHKIPGTAYANSVALPVTATDPPNTFKTKMEQLKDTSSTNLYMEGLPLSIDDQTLQALVNPHKVMSSRRFQTRLSNPPRIIAFVRLESRQAAEDVIERLHGRMVRGWRDAGSRISVRFADTSEQRELRRVERMNRDGENSPARLTMAQAALLNLKGTQLQSDARIPSPNFSMSPPLSSNMALPTDLYGPAALPPPIGLHNQPSIPDLSLITEQLGALNSRAANAMSGLRIPPHMLGYDTAPGLSRDFLEMQAAMGGDWLGSNAAVRSHNGFTEMERLILQAHDRQRLTGPNHEFNVAAPEFRPSSRSVPAQNGSVGHGREASRRLVDVMPSMSEEDFHACASSAGGGRQLVLSPTADGDAFGHPSSNSDEDVSRLSMDLDSRLTYGRQRNQTHAGPRVQGQDNTLPQALHARSTTVPSHYFNTGRAQLNQVDTRGADTIYSSATHTVGNSTQGLGNSNKSTSLRTGSSVTNGNSILRGGNNVNTNSRNNNTIRENNLRSLGAGDNSSAFSSTKSRMGNPATASSGNPFHSRINTSTHNRKYSSFGRGTGSHEEDDEDGSGLESPALSYSTRTPASLSPSTPYSAFGETFDGPPLNAAKVNVSATGKEIGLGMGGMSLGNTKHQMSLRGGDR